MTKRVVCTVLIAAALLSGCVMRTAEEGPGTPAPPPGQAIGAVRPPPPVPVQPPPAPPEPPATPAPRQFHLGTASRALVAQAHAQAKGGDFGQASATIERALRIEPENPLLWIELGRMRLGAGDADQADSMGHKALSLGTGDPAAQAGAWRLIADSLQARGRNGQAADAARRAAGFTPR
ncbi:MAG: tetratricopeptide repeat protein [Steroidobacterales bacterium]